MIYLLLIEIAFDLEDENGALPPTHAPSKCNRAVLQGVDKNTPKKIVHMNETKNVGLNKKRQLEEEREDYFTDDSIHMKVYMPEEDEGLSRLSDQTDDEPLNNCSGNSAQKQLSPSRSYNVTTPEKFVSPNKTKENAGSSEILPISSQHFSQNVQRVSMNSYCESISIPPTFLL